jgi:GT2 family glycosyltransferase
MVILSIIIVNYNAGLYLGKCLESIKSQRYKQYEVIIIDNSSVDDSLRYVTPTDNIKVICNSTNYGFAKAQNQGIGIARGKYILPLNYDILLEPDFLAEMVKAIELSDQIGTVAPKLMRMTVGLEKSYQFDNAGLLLPPNRLPYHRGRGELDRGQYDEPVRVFGAMGAAALYRREMLEDIAFKGQFYDETYFMWYEDIDLDWRARTRGWHCLYAPCAVAYHIGDVHGHGKSKLGARISIRNRWMTILTNDCLSTMFFNAPPLVIEELKLLGHVIKFGLVKEYLWAVLSLSISIPYVFKKRRFVQHHASHRYLPDFPLPFEEQANAL